MEILTPPRRAKEEAELLASIRREIESLLPGMPRGVPLLPASGLTMADLRHMSGIKGG